MAPKSTRAVALLPIRPQYATAIMRGEKRVEFRRRGFSRDVEFVVVYASSPVQKILGLFRISGIAEGHPQELWDRYADVGAIGLDAFTRYYAGAEHACAIGIDRVCVFQTPLSLSALGERRAPQSFKYIDLEDLARLPEAAAWLDDELCEPREYAMAAD